MVSCKKDNAEPNVSTCDTTFVDVSSFDTLPANNYFGAWPGSWWEYDDGNTDSCTHWELYSLYDVSKVSNCVTIIEDKKYLPVIEGNVIHDRYYVTTNNYYQTWTKIIGDLGETYPEHFYGTGAKQFEFIEVIDTLTISGNNYFNVAHIKIKEYQNYYSGYGGPMNLYENFYAPQMGIIRKIKKPYYPGNGTFDTIDLVDYYIAPH